MEAACKEINNFVSPGTLRMQGDFFRPRIAWKKRIDASILERPIGWHRFFLQLEKGEEMCEAATKNPVVCDSLSFVATIDFVMEQIAKQKNFASLQEQGFKIQNVVLFGAAASETKLLEKTNYFDLLATRYGVRFSLVGPEIKGKVLFLSSIGAS